LCTGKKKEEEEKENGLSPRPDTYSDVINIGLPP
jgi:hypothetical protein